MVESRLEQGKRAGGRPRGDSCAARDARPRGMKRPGHPLPPAPHLRISRQYGSTARPRVSGRRAVGGFVCRRPGAWAISGRGCLGGTVRRRRSWPGAPDRQIMRPAGVAAHPDPGLWVRAVALPPYWRQRSSDSHPGGIPIDSSDNAGEVGKVCSNAVSWWLHCGLASIERRR